MHLHNAFPRNGQHSERISCPKIFFRSKKSSLLKILNVLDDTRCNACLVEGFSVKRRIVVGELQCLVKAPFLNLPHLLPWEPLFFFIEVDILRQFKPKPERTSYLTKSRLIFQEKKQ